MPHRRIAPPCLALVALLVLTATTGCSRREALAENVVLISIDTLRRDHLGCYGYEHPTSPNLDALCEESAVFDQAISHAPSTLLSHASMLTSLLPDRHGASFAKRTGLPEEVVTLAEVLQQAGFGTASFNEGAQIAPPWGLGQGFDLYRSSDDWVFNRRVDEALEWLDGTSRDTPFFLFLHTYEVHHPYTPSEEDLSVFRGEPYRGWLGRRVGFGALRKINTGRAEAGPEDLAFIEDAYDAEIRSMDRALGRLLDGLRGRGLLESTLVVFTSDHGEEFGEHGKVGWHSHTLYDELLRVPLVVRFPGERWSASKVQRQVRLIDVAPTVLDAVGLEAPIEWQGTSLLALLREEGVPSLLALSMIDRKDGRETYSLRTGRWKLYKDQLFDLSLDPEELYDSSSGNWELVQALKSHLAELTADRRRNVAGSVELDAETRERLQALGYL